MAEIDRILKRNFWLSILYVACINVFYFLYLFFKPGSQEVFVAIDSLMPALVPLPMICFCAYEWFSFRHSLTQAKPSQKWSVFFLCLYTFLYAAGYWYWSYALLILKEPLPTPSLADAGWLAAYPALAIGILLLPKQRLEASTRIRTLLDGLIILTSIVAFSWYFILGPTMLQVGGGLLAQIVESAYPFFDLVLFACLLLMSMRTIEKPLKTTVYLLSLSLLVILAVDCVFDIQVLQQTYVAGELLDTGWPLALTLVGLAAQALLHTMVRQRHHAEAPEQKMVAETPSLWRALLPYILVLLVLLLAVDIYVNNADNAILSAGVYIGSAIVIALVLLRQVFMVRETISYAQTTRQLNIELQTAHTELSEKNKALEQANERLEAMATTDPLTGLLNHRALVQMLDQEIERADRYGHAVSILFFDLDHFKAINDGYGHATGDSILREFAQLGCSVLRRIDTLGRWGGEEFIALLPETDTEAARDIARRLRASVAEHIFPAGGGIRMTCSLGIATFPEDAAERDSLVAAADQAMYTAKKLGRNQVRLAREAAVLAIGNDTASPGSREDVALSGTVEALSKLVEERDPYMGQHTRMVAQQATRVALAMGLEGSEAQMIGLAGRLHDIGKVGVPDSILQKPSKLTPEEWEIIHRHPAIGANVVSEVPSLRAIAPIIRAHHERIDGRGYPEGLVGENIPLGARILAVVDAFDAMMSHRPYREAHSQAWALAELRRNAGKQFDADVIAAFERVLTEAEEHDVVFVV